MLLSSQQITELLQIIQNNQSILVASQLGLDFLSEYDKALLEAHGVDWTNLYSEENDSIFQSFHLGMLAQALNDVSSLQKLDYKTVKQYIREGQYIPLTERERSAIQYIKNQTFSDVRTLNGRIFQETNAILSNHTLKDQVEFIKEELVEGIKKQKSFREIANTLHHKTGDWSRDFDRIVEYQMNSAYQQGRVSFMEKNNPGRDPEVYKKVFTSACKHCIRLYLTDGFGSEPIIFKLSELKANGSNIGRKVVDWKATVDSTHPYCRCLLIEKRQGYKWNKETQAFDILDEETRPKLKTPRAPIRVKIGGREVSV